MNLYGSICLTDIPKELIREGKNGKKYLSIVVNKRQSADKYGNTHYIKAYAKKDERKPDVNYYIGDMKESGYSDGAGGDQQQQQTSQNNFDTAVNRSFNEMSGIPF